MPSSHQPNVAIETLDSSCFEMLNIKVMYSVEKSFFLSTVIAFVL